MVTIIAGSREFSKQDDLMLIDAACGIAFYEGITISKVLSGCAPGIDTLAIQYAEEAGYPVDRYPADWKIHGMKAGYLRNERMAKDAEALIAIWDGKSKGTKHMIDIATRKGLKVYVHLVEDIDGHA